MTLLSDLQLGAEVLICQCLSENGKWLPILQSAGKRQHSVSFVYRSYHLPMPDPSPSTLTV